MDREVDPVRESLSVTSLFLRASFTNKKSYTDLLTLIIPNLETLLIWKQNYQLGNMNSTSSVSKLILIFPNEKRCFQVESDVSLFKSIILTNYVSNLTVTLSFNL